MNELKKKKEERVEKQDKIQALVDAAQKSTLTEAQKAEFDTLEKEIETLDADVKRLEKMEQMAKASAKFENPVLPGAPAEDGEFKELEKVSKRFSIGKAFKSMSNKKQVLDGAEKEIYEVAAKEAKDAGTTLEGNIAIPQSLIQLGKRKALTVATEGADVVFTDYGGKVIPYLNPMPVADQLGVTFLQGLRGNVQWPRETGDLSFGFETETSDNDETTPTFDNVSISPKRFGGYVDITMQMMNQSVFALDSWLRNKLNLRYAITVDNQIFNGTGSGNQCTGLFYISGVNTLSTGSGGASNDMTYRALLSMKRDAKVANARMGRSGWVTNAYGEFALYNTPLQGSGVEGNFILNANNPGRLVADPFFTSEIIPSNFSEGSQSDLVGIAYSTNWAGLIAGFWGGIDILFDPYTQKLGGKNRFVVNSFMDVDVEQPLEFSICKDWDASDLPALT